MTDEPERNDDGQFAAVAIPTAAELRAMGRTEYDEIKEDAFYVIRRRLKAARGPKGGGKAGRIEDTHLFSLATNLLKIEANREAADARNKPGEHRSPQVLNITNLINGLPVERARELLVAAIRQLEAAGQDASPQRETLMNLVGPDETGRLLAIDAGGSS